ncbi:hypothetical protein C7S18_23995 (plasmid) [Ahniella affigens]|uniref:ATPase dynein-related AAA domain-containing protein n=2 Tax=Ahniella affigens TaxID=2021234 RepID=A0A2P1PZU4_9GAMM|nr:hypothetical protein C7S18_23995 [Ahniella affigens]
MFTRQIHDIRQIVGAATPVEVEGFAPVQHPLLPAINPVYQFRRDLLRPVIATWKQALHRHPHQPIQGLFLTGPSGSGKTSIVTQLFARLNVPVFVFDATRSTDLMEGVRTVGIEDGNTIDQPGGIVQAMIGGYPVLINEVDVLKPEEGTLLYSILDSGQIATPDGQVVKAAPGFAMIFSANTNGTGDDTGLYAGTRRQSAALTRRVRVVEVGYMDADQEKRVLKAHFPDLDAALLDKVMRVLASTRNSANNGSDGILRGLSTDETVSWINDALLSATMERDGLNPFVETLMWNYANKLQYDARDAVRKLAQGVFGGAAA